MAAATAPHWWQRIPSEIRNAGAVIAIAVTMASLFAAAYTVALGRPLPHNLPVGVVGPPAHTDAALAMLQGGKNSFAAVTFPDREAALAAIDNQQISAVVDASGNPPQLLISSAGDPPAARVLLGMDQIAPGRFSMPVIDLHPLPASDPAGLATFYLVIAATILGFVTMFQLRANVKTLTLKGWLACIFVVAVAGGAALAWVTGTLLHALSAPFAELWLLSAAQIGIAALLNCVMLVLVHRWAIIPTWGFFILLGNTSSGGAVSAALLPQPFAFLNHALPTGATVSAIHTASYFTDHQHPLPFVVLGIWLLATFTALVVASRTLQRTPAD